MAFLLGHDAAAYRHAAIAVDGLDPAAVSLQHEFGIYGGPDGANVLAFAERLRAPLVTTLHTVLPEPTGRQRDVIRELGRQSAALVVMSETAKSLLARRYDVDPDVSGSSPTASPTWGASTPRRASRSSGSTGARSSSASGSSAPARATRR